MCCTVHRKPFLLMEPNRKCKLGTYTCDAKNKLRSERVLFVSIHLKVPNLGSLTVRHYYSYIGTMYIVTMSLVHRHSTTCRSAVSGNGRWQKRAKNILTQALTKSAGLRTVGWQLVYRHTFAVSNVVLFVRILSDSTVQFCVLKIPIGKSLNGHRLFACFLNLQYAQNTAIIALHMQSMLSHCHI